MSRRKSTGPIRGAKGKRQKDNAKALVALSAEHPRMAIAYSLQLSEDEALRRLGDQLTDDAFARTSVATMARQHGISYKRIATCVFDAKVDEGKIRMAPFIPQMMEDTAKDALSKEKQCPVCDGSGLRSYGAKKEDERGEMQAVAEACKECNGTGLVRVAGDTNARKMVFEAGGLVGKGIQVDARSITVNDNSSLADTLKLVKQVREVQRAVVTNAPLLTGGEDGTD